MNGLTWIDEVLEDFGRRFGLEDLRLAENGAAALDLAGGRTLLFELTRTGLWVSLEFPLEPTDENMKLLLAEAEPPRYRRGIRIHAGYLPEKRRGLLSTVIATNDLMTVSLEAVWDALKARADKIGGGAWA